MSRHYTDQEWAKIIARLWLVTQSKDLRLVMTIKRTLWSAEMGKEYGWMLCAMRRPSRALVLWLLERLKELTPL